MPAPHHNAALCRLYQKPLLMLAMDPLKPNQHLKLRVVLLNHSRFCFVARYIILLKGTTANSEYHFHERL